MRRAHRRQGTDTIVATLERVMASHPDHPGANHYYIHAVEASNQPDRATRQAERLETLVPGAGHLVHMPAHIYIRTGQYARSAKSNADAARVDEALFQDRRPAGHVPRDVLRPQPAVRVGGGDVRGPLRAGARGRPADGGPGRSDRRRLADARALRAAGRRRAAAVRTLRRGARAEGAGADAHRPDRALSLHAGRGLRRPGQGRRCRRASSRRWRRPRRAWPRT